MFLCFRYQAQVQLARDALQAQGLEEEVINQTLERLTQPVEPLTADSTGSKDRRTESGKDQVNGHEVPLSPQVKEDTESCEDTTLHVLDSSLEQSNPSDGLRSEGEDSPEAKRQRRQGNPDYDPLAYLYPDEPKQLDETALAQVRCVRHDDWIIHCGCRLRDSQLEAVPLTKGGVQDYEYVLVEEQQEDESTQSLGNANVSIEIGLILLTFPF